MAAVCPLGPGVQQAARCPDPRPVPRPAALGAGKHVLGRPSTKRQNQRVVNGLAVQQFDAAGDDGLLAAPSALVLDPAPQRH
jgi:hypothetical protein